MGHFVEIATTPAVAAEQAANGSAPYWQDDTTSGLPDQFGAREAEFIAARDSFYLSSISETGWPYVQHRGGPLGFLRVFDANSLGFADYRGNRQYISTGNLRANPRCCLFLMDYPNRRRLKIYAHAEILALAEAPELAERLRVAPYRALPERLYRFRLEAFDWNCPQHITPRFSEAELQAPLAGMRAKLKQLAAENEALRARIAQSAAKGANP